MIFWINVVKVQLCYGAEITFPMKFRPGTTRICARNTWDNFWGKQMLLVTCAVSQHSDRKRPQKAFPVGGGGVGVGASEALTLFNGERLMNEGWKKDSKGCIIHTIWVYISGRTHGSLDHNICPIFLPHPTARQTFFSLKKHESCASVSPSAIQIGWKDSHRDGGDDWHCLASRHRSRVWLRWSFSPDDKNAHFVEWITERRLKCFCSAMIYWM